MERVQFHICGVVEVVRAFLEGHFFVPDGFVATRPSSSNLWAWASFVCSWGVFP